MTNKRGQAALEFLTTYGWAFLVILVMIGALAYFGVLDPTRFLPQRCQFGAEMHCDKFALDSESGGGYFALKNALPSHVIVTNLTWSVPELEGWFMCEDEATLGGSGPSNDINVTDNMQGQVFNRETIQDFVCLDSTGPNNMGADGALQGLLISGDKQRVQFRVTYNEGNQAELNYQKYIYGEIYANVK